MLLQPLSLRWLAVLSAWLLASALGGCGGGAGGGGDAGATAPPPITTPEGYPLQSALKTRMLAGGTDEFVVSGTCNGTATLTAAAPVAGNFEGVAGFQISQSSQVALTDCTPASTSSTGSTFVDASYGLLGASTAGVDYAKFAANPTALPAKVRSGDSGTVVTLNTYTSSSKLTATGSRTWGYSIEADTATSVVVNFITKTYNTTGQLLSTQQARYRLDAAGMLVVISIDTQYSNTSQNHLIYTPKRVASAATFPLQRAYQTRVAAGSTDNFTVSGTCSGNSVIVVGTPQAVTFEGVSALRTTQTNTLSLTNCTPASLVITDQTFLDAASTPLGASQVGLDYAKFAQTSTPWPVSVKVGDSGSLATLTTYTNDTKATATGQRALTYTIEPDSSTTAIVNVMARSTNTAGDLLLNQQTRYRIDAAGSLELVSIDTQYATTSTVQLVYTSTRPVGGMVKFPLLQAYKAKLAAGSSERFAVSGSCHGTATLTESAPASANFEGSTALTTSQTALLNLSDCSPATSAITGTNYYDSASLLLGSITTGQEYAKAAGTATALPAEAQVGDVGTVVILNVYTDNSKTVSTGRRVLSYEVEADSANTALVNFITRTYNTSEQLTSTQQSRYRLDVAGNLKSVSVDLQNAVTSSLHLIYTPLPGSFTQGPTWPW